MDVGTGNRRKLVRRERLPRGIDRKIAYHKREAPARKSDVFLLTLRAYDDPLLAFCVSFRLTQCPDGWKTREGQPGWFAQGGFLEQPA